MKQIPLLIIPFFTLLLISIPASTVNSAKTSRHDTRINILQVTDAVIAKICPQTTNPGYCTNLMSTFMGKPLFPDNFRTIISKAQAYANTKANELETLYLGVNDEDKPQQKIKMRYRNCWKAYSDASDQLKRSMRSLQRDKDSRNVKLHTSYAMSRVSSCSERKFHDICSVVLSICDNFWPQRG